MAAGKVTEFLHHTFRHFNAGEVIRAASALRDHLDGGGHLLVTLAGAMSTAEIGVTLAEMIRQRRVHAVCCTGANLEEDVFNLIAHDKYQPVSHFRYVTPAEDQKFLDAGLNRVTDTCIPEREAVRPLADAFLTTCQSAERSGARQFPHEVIFDVLRRGVLRDRYVIDTAHSWVHAAMERDLPVFVPGWEDSTLGNMFAAACMSGKIQNCHTIRGGIEYLIQLAHYYQETSTHRRVGFLQIGGGIAGDFAICVVPMLRQDLERTEVPLWSYFCQISDSTTSFGSYSGAPPSEKITWGKLDASTPAFMIESDATIVAPLLFAMVLGW